MALEEVGTKLIVEGQSKFHSDMKSAEDQTTGFGRALSKVADGIAQGFGQALFGAVSKGIGMIPNLMKSAVDSTMAWGQRLDDIGDILGTTNAQSAGLATMFQTIGGSSEQLTGAMAKMTMGLLDAKGQLGPTGTALNGLGIKFKDVKGKMLPATTIFQNIADKIGNMPDGLEKTSLMMDIFGKSGKEMGDALAAASNGGMDLYIRKAKDMGLVLDPQEIIDQKIAAQTLDLAFKGIQITLGKALLPVIQQVTYGIMHMLSDPSVKAGIKFISEGIATLGEIFGNFFEDIRAGDWDAALGGLGDDLLNIIPPELQDAFVEFYSGLNNVINFVVDSWPAISETFQTVGDTISGVMDWIKGFIKSALDIIKGWWDTNGNAIIGAVTTMWNGVKGLFSAAAEFIKTLVSFLLVNIQTFWQTHGDTIMGIVQWIWDTATSIFNTAVSVITSIFQAFTDLLEGDWEGFKTNLLTAWDTLWEQIKAAAIIAWAKLTEWFKTIIHQILAYFYDTDWGKIGTDIIDGIWSGLKNGWDWLIERVRELARSLLAAALGDLNSSNVKIGANGAVIKAGTPPPPAPGGVEQYARGGSFIIPKEYGFEGFNMGGMASASAGEQVTITPAPVSAGPSNYQYSYATNYNLNLSTQQSAQSVQQSFAIMRMLAG